MRSYSNLPDEITVEIASRLPAKSVGVCRCVSKRWRALLSQPNFIRTHLHRSRILQQDSLILSSKRHGGMYCAPLSHAHQLFDEITVRTKQLGFSSHLDWWSRDCASCDGLLLVRGREGKTFVLNPVIGEIREVPNSPFTLDPDKGYTLHGFGYDPASDDYKIVTLSCYPSANSGPDSFVDCSELFVNIYSLKTGSWRRAGAFPCRHSVRHLGSGAFVGGCLHWLARTKDYDYSILAFNLVEEKFHELPPPSSVNKVVFHCCDVLDGCLCVSDIRGPIWVMKGYGIKESWTKFTVNDPYCWHWCFLSLEQVVMVKDKKYIMYNLKQGTWKSIVIDDGSEEFSITGKFLESLVSPSWQ